MPFRHFLRPPFVTSAKMAFVTTLRDDRVNMKMPAVVRKKSSLTTNVRDMVKIDVPEDSDGSGSASLFLKKIYIPLSDIENKRCFGTVLLPYSTPIIIWKYKYITT